MSVYSVQTTLNIGYSVQLYGYWRGEETQLVIGS